VPGPLYPGCARRKFFGQSCGNRYRPGRGAVSRGREWRGVGDVPLAQQVFGLEAFCMARGI